MKISTAIRARLSQVQLLQTARDLPLRIRNPVSYSQHAEDLYVYNNILSGKRKNGTYIDIGASHPARLSNTYYFYKKGWRGLVVEPISALIDLHRHWRPEDTHVQFLIGEHDGEGEFFHLYPSVLSTVSKEEMEKNIAAGSVLLSKKTIPQFKISTLIDNFLGEKRVEFMSVDVEGIDLLIALQVANLPQEMRPQILCIEGNTLLIKNELRNILKKSYKNQHDIGCNIIFW